jgi:hypothetical protein
MSAWGHEITTGSAGTRKHRSSTCTFCCSACSRGLGCQRHGCWATLWRHASLPKGPDQHGTLVQRLYGYSTVQVRSDTCWLVWRGVHIHILHVEIVIRCVKGDRKLLFIYLGINCLFRIIFTKPEHGNSEGACLYTRIIRLYLFIYRKRYTSLPGNQVMTGAKKHAYIFNKSAK